MKKVLPFLIMFAFIAFIYWLFLFTTYWLTCKSYERFDNAQTRMAFPFWCEVSGNGQDYVRIVW